MVSVDGTDFQIDQPTFKKEGLKRGKTKAWYSHKIITSAVRYEVAVSIIKGDIVWINGPYPPGDWNDVDIFRDSLASHLDEFERVEADDGYVGEAPLLVKCPMCVTNPEDTKVIQRKVRARQETANKRFKQWGCLTQTFRHDVRKHSEVFRAVAVITQLSIQLGEPLFQVPEYSEEMSL